MSKSITNLTHSTLNCFTDNAVIVKTVCIQLAVSIHC